MNACLDPQRTLPTTSYNAVFSYSGWRARKNSIAEFRLLVSTPRINALSDWSLRRGAPQIFFLVGDLGGAPPK
jgi:hypothetical protein